jgi:hypothetical protein
MKTYFKPFVTRIEMRPKEAVLNGCKTDNNLAEAPCLHNEPGIQYGCVYPGSGGDACWATPGS